MGRRRNLSDLVRFGRFSVRLDGFVVSEPEFRFRELRNFHTRNLSELIGFGRFSVRVDGIVGLEPEFRFREPQFYLRGAPRSNSTSHRADVLGPS